MVKMHELEYEYKEQQYSFEVIPSSPKYIPKAKGVYEFPYHQFIKLNYDQYLFIKDLKGEKIPKRGDFLHKNSIKKSFLKDFCNYLNEIADEFNKKSQLGKECIPDKKRGNDLEKIAKNVFQKKGLVSPTNYKKDTKFPDVIFVNDNKTYYLEIKSHRICGSKSTTSFNVDICSRGGGPRPIKENAYHFIFSLYVAEVNRKWVAEKWVLRDMYKLKGRIVIYIGGGRFLSEINEKLKKEGKEELEYFACLEFKSSRERIENCDKVLSSEMCKSSQKTKKSKKIIEKKIGDRGTNNKISGY